MGSVYSAQNVAAYLIYELKEQTYFLNQTQLQQLLANVDSMWNKVFGHCAFTEATQTDSHYYVREVFESYNEQENRIIEEPAREWFLQYGCFQLEYRPYCVPVYSQIETILMEKILKNFTRKRLTCAS